ncbi:Barrierpepsin [Orbilia brochopaga]|nr:Barrierpepsin [Drechslerella brochopaga]
MATSWSAVLVSLLCLGATTQFARAWESKAASLKLRSNPLPDTRLTKRDYIATSFRPNNETAAFYVDVLIGTPPQFFSLALSTDSSTWVPSPKNKNATKFCDQDATGSSYWSCFYDHFFEPKSSSTFRPQNGTLDRNYGSGIFAEGTWGSDVFKINQLTISNVSFGLATNWTTGGKLGLGVGYDKLKSPYPTIPEVMASENDINLILYSVYVNDIRADGGDLYFGAVDDAKYNGTLKSWDEFEVSQIPVSGVYWVSPNGTNSSLTSGLTQSRDVGEIQLGTPSLWLPNSVYSTLINSIPDLRYSASYEAYTLDCGSADPDMGTLQFDIDGIVISIAVRQILLEYPPGSGTCVFTVYQNEDAGLTGPDYLLGTPFLRAAYSVFDFTNNQTSIAPSIANSTGSSLREVPAGGVAALAQEASPSTSTPTVSPTSLPPIVPTTATASPSSSKTNVAAIAGGTVGGVALVIAGVIAFLFVRRRRRQRESEMPQPPMQDSGPVGGPAQPQIASAGSYGAGTGHTAPFPQPDPYSYVPQQYKPPDAPTSQSVQHTYGYPNSYTTGATNTHAPSSYHENWGTAAAPHGASESGNGGRSASMASGSSATYAQDLSSYSGGPVASPPPNAHGGYEYNNYNGYTGYANYRP